MYVTEDKWHHASHFKYLIKLHMIFVCKYRKALLTGKIKEDIKKNLQDAAKMKGFNIETMESDIDHIHMYVDIRQTQSASQVAHILKQISTYRIWKQHEQELKKHFTRERTFWTDGSFACTGPVDEELIRKYIESQGKANDILKEIHNYEPGFNLKNNCKRSAEKRK